MEVTGSIQAVRAFVRDQRNRGQSIGFVPTMGALHIGHIALIRAARKSCDMVVVSIFVNPTQFGPSEDLATYPRPFEQDCDICRDEDVALLFAPTAEEMYGDEDNLTWVDVVKLTEPLCGRTRKGHFRGVTTVCAKLFNIVLPDTAFFGQKDAQQAIVIQRMVRDLNMPLTIEVCPTVREPDGLAVSSRNQYLNPQQRQQASVLYQGHRVRHVVQACEAGFAGGQREVTSLIAIMTDMLASVTGMEIEYVSIVDAQTLMPLERISTQALVAMAVRLGPARLIDNILIDGAGS